MTVISGMAHFSGTGLPNKKCLSCTFFDLNSKPQGTVKGRCSKFKILTGKVGKEFNGTSLSCKYIEEKK
jgi:hypothetical protein